MAQAGEASGPCVAVATDDGLEVKLGHFGDARYYFHYTPGPRPGTWTLLRVVENPYRDEGHHHAAGPEGETGKRRRIYQLNRGCSAIVATALGPGGAEFMEEHGLRVIKVKPHTTIREALEEAVHRLSVRG